MFSAWRGQDLNRDRYEPLVKVARKPSSFPVSMPMRGDVWIDVFSNDYTSMNYWSWSGINFLKSSEKENSCCNNVLCPSLAHSILSSVLCRSSCKPSEQYTGSRRTWLSNAGNLFHSVSPLTDMRKPFELSFNLFLLFLIWLICISFLFLLFASFANYSCLCLWSAIWCMAHCGGKLHRRFFKQMIDLLTVKIYVGAAVAQSV
jgi:hypothetical protein